MLEVERKIKNVNLTKEELEKRKNKRKPQDIITKNIKEVVKISKDGKVKTTEYIEEKTNITKKMREEAKIVKQENAKKVIEELEKIYKVK